MARQVLRLCRETEQDLGDLVSNSRDFFLGYGCFGVKWAERGKGLSPYDLTALTTHTAYECMPSRGQARIILQVTWNTSGDHDSLNFHFILGHLAPSFQDGTNGCSRDNDTGLPENNAELPLATGNRYILVDSSGANLNPAVSIALVIGRRITVERFVVYVIAQVSCSQATGFGWLSHLSVYVDTRSVCSCHLEYLAEWEDADMP